MFHWSEDLAGNRAVACKTNAGSANELPFVVGNNIVQESCKLSCDLIYYEDEIGIPSPMVRIQEELENLSKEQANIPTPGGVGRHVGQPK